MHLFTAENAEGQIKECDEGTLEWIDWDRLGSLPIWEGDKVFLKLLETRKTFFSLKLVYDGEILVSVKLDGKELARCDW